MKRSLSILLLLIFLFNVGGYYIVYWGLRYETDRQLTRRLDGNFHNPDEEIELKIPVALPYPIQSQDFQRVEGRFEHNGEFFNLIKHKLKDDTLYIVCIRDHETKRIVTAINDYVQLVQGLPETSSSQGTWQLLSKLVKDFCSQKEIEILHEYGIELLISFAPMADDFAGPILAIHSPPPRS